MGFDTLMLILGTLSVRIQQMNYKLSPLDLTFNYEGCKRCFYQKVVNNIAQLIEMVRL